MNHPLIEIRLIAFICILLIYANAGPSCSKQERRDVKSWTKYKHCFKQSFHPDDDETRKRIFKENVKTVMALNSMHPTARFGMNKFGHMTVDEYRQKFLGSTITKESQHFASTKKFKSVDWREKGVVTRVKNQKHCGSCYAFSAIGAVESAYAIMHKHGVLLSEQQIVDCSQEYGNNGCNGGLMENVFNYVRDLGSMKSDDYDYIARESDCKYNRSGVVTRIRGYESIASGNETQLTEILRQIGPVSVAVDASQHSFMFYQEGIYDDPQCSSTALNHGVLAVGVTNQYYIVKNSWGKSWGLDGYIYIARGKNRCGVASQASYPVY